MFGSGPRVDSDLHFAEIVEKSNTNEVLMNNLFEKQDSLNRPVECFVFDAEKETFPVKPHWHYFAEFIFMLRGSVEVSCDESTCTVGEGELIMIHPSTVHSICSADGTLPVYAVLKFDMARFPGSSSFSPSPSEIFRYARSEGMKVHFDRLQCEGLRCREIFEGCIREVQDYLYGADVMLRSRIYQLIYGIVRLWIDEGLSIGDCPTSESGYGIENITEYIDKHLDGRLRVSELAKECHLSHSNFAAKFHRQYGMSCKEYIERMKLFKSEEYLMYTDQDLSMISQQIGFSDQSHFIRCFKKFRGMTPRQFRQQRKPRS